MTYTPSETPVKLEKVDLDHVAIHWADGHRCVYKGDFLRYRCPCAHCIDEWTGKVLVKWEDCDGVKLKRIEQTGSYAFSLEYSDGHSGGIYSFRFLRRLCEEAEEGQRAEFAEPPADPDA